MNDITEYSKDELSLNVFNEQGLYLARHEPYIFDLIDEYFIYTDEQKAVLIEDLEADLNEQL